jgi:hypothetical protein
MGSEFHLRATSDDRRPPKIKPPPQSSAISAPFSYSPSDDGTDENLLVLLHGLGSHTTLFFYVVDNEFSHLTCLYCLLFFLMQITYILSTRDNTTITPGDTHVPFSKLSRSFKLPQTATLALRAPEQYVTP